MNANIVVKFISFVGRGNNKGAGFVLMPKETSVPFNFGERVKVELPGSIYFFAKMAKIRGRVGVYVPRGITLKNNLLYGKVAVRIIGIDGFYSRISSDGRIYIPQDIAKKQKIGKNDIVLIKGIEKNRVEEKYSKILVNNRQKRGRTECSAVFGRSFYGKEFLFQIEKKTCDKRNLNVAPILKKVLKGMQYALIDDRSLIIFKGNKVPAVVNSKFKYSEIALYLGAYFADGTKKGNSWAICASTFEQANFYLKMHNFLVKDAKPEFIVSYTDRKNEKHNDIISQLKKIWEEKTNIKIRKFRIRNSTGKSLGKHNQYGTLIIREHRQILLDFYNGLLKFLIHKVLLKRNKNLAINFLCGVIEGDGCAPAKKRGHLLIALNKENSDILRDIVRIAEIKFKTIREGEYRYFLRIGALEILKNFFYFNNKLFALYPKRKEKLLERLKTVGAVKYLIGNHEPASWVKAWFFNNGFANKRYKLTRKGLELSKALKDIYKTKTK